MTVALDLTHFEREEREHINLILSADPFQEIGIPCWSGYAGPLDNPNEPELPFAEND